MPVRRIFMGLYANFLREWDTSIDDVDCRLLTSQGQYYLAQGNLPDAIASLVEATKLSTRPRALPFLLDSIKFLEEAERSRSDEAVFTENLASAKQSIDRFKLPDTLAEALGRISLPIFVKPIERQVYKFFKAVGSATYADIAGHLGVSVSTVKRILTPMVERGILLKAETSPGQAVVFYLPSSK